MTPKPELRRELRARRDSFVAMLGDPEAAARPVIDRLEVAISDARIVAGYVPIGSEFPILSALSRAAAFGKATALPRVDSLSDLLRFLPWSPGDPLERGYFGLSQPLEDDAVTPDLVLTPLTGFDRAGGRLGQGAGFYDRWFAANPQARRIGVAWSVQEVKRLTMEEWDMRLHAIVTEHEWIAA